MLTWHYVTQAVYDAASETDKTSDKLYYTSDTHQIYRGPQLFTQAYELYSTLPTTPAVGRIYIDSSTLEGKVYNGSAWTTVIQPVQAAVDSTDTTKPVSGKAVADYVAAELTDVTSEAELAFVGASYSADTNAITFTRNSGTDSVSVEITDLPCDLKYDSDTGLLQLADKAGAALGTGINLDLERFVKSGEYNPDTKEITLYFDDDKTDSITIDAAALVDIYVGTESTTASVSVSADNKITATVKVSTADGNQLSVDETNGGLFVAATDLSALDDKQDKDTDAVAGNLAKFDANGNSVDAGIVAGAATLAATPNATTLATEAAVEAIRATLQANVDGKIAKVSDATAGDVATLTADGQVADSGVAVGGATLAATPSEKTLATEAAVEGVRSSLQTSVDTKQDKDTDAVAGNLAKFDSDGNSVDAGIVAGAATLATSPVSTTLATEAAVADALTWKTVV